MPVEIIFNRIEFKSVRNTDETLSAVGGGDPLVDLMLSPGIPCWKLPAKTDGFTKPIDQKGTQQRGR